MLSSLLPFADCRRMAEEADSRDGAGSGGGNAPPPGGGAKGVDVIPLVYDFLVWIGPQPGAFPRIHRYTVGDRIMTTSLEVLDQLIVAQARGWARAEVKT